MSLTAHYYTTTWCGPCKIGWPMVEEVCREHGVPLAKIDVEQDLVDGGRALHIIGVPTVIFRENNVEVVRVTGVHPRADYVAVIEGLHAS